MSQPWKDTINDARQTGNPDTCIIGGDYVGHEIANRLVNKGVSVALVDTMPPSDPPPELTVHCGASLGLTELRRVNIHEGTTILSVCPEDGVNLLMAQLARTQFGVDRVIARVNDPRRVTAFKDLNIETVDAAAALGRLITERW
ncbi:NAD-binding protein [Haladaptatus pallidirubidus]|uniref:RCK N-terminal domain-containing protein n=1 Tax=Haladaptatus pallidirubidus TaxID=1008152 RepID=A0AAV3UKH2_9EURY|nr:NAD-binding protein [Haladaptatus pallidirubidus]